MVVLGVWIGIALAAAAAVASAWVAIVGRSRTVVHGPAHGAAKLVERELRVHQHLASFLRRRTSPGEITGLALTLSLGALVAFGALTYQVRAGSDVTDADRSVATWAADHATAASTDVLDVFTDVGSTPVVALLALIVTLVEVTRRHTRNPLLFLVVVMGGQVALTNLVKLAVGRDRPDLDQLVGASGFSFPSGHSATAAACLAACAVCLGRGRTRWMHLLLATTAATLAVMVAGSRVLLGVHWMSDAVAGLVLGWSWFTLCAIAFGGRLLHFGAPVVAATRVDAARESDGPGAEASTDRPRLVVTHGAARQPRADDDRDAAEQPTDDDVAEVVHPEQHA